MGHVESKTRSVGQILEKPCVLVMSQKSLIMGNCQVQN